jgi:hypothetical protein
MPVPIRLLSTPILGVALRAGTSPLRRVVEDAKRLETGECNSSIKAKKLLLRWSLRIP